MRFDMKQALLFLYMMRRASSQSGCEICAATGQCQVAFKQQPGQFCGTFFDQNQLTQRPCCCPIQSSCRVAYNRCACHVNPSGYNNYNPSQRTQNYRNNDYRNQQYSNQHYSNHHHSNSYGHDVSGSASPVGIIVFLLVCCCCMMRSKRRDLENSRQGFTTNSVPVATAVPSYGATRDKDFGTHHCHDSNNNTGNAIASGLGGLAVGTILGDMFGSSRNANAHHNAYNAVGNRGGYDIAGDTATGGGYDIAGDTGGGYDIAGDTGDSGFDISGDS